MTSEKTLALVLRVIPFSESSIVVTFFTRDFGKISALAKGARRRKSAFEAALDLLALCRIVFLHKQSESLDLLTEAKLERRFHSASRNLPRLYAAYYVAELLSSLTDRGDPHPDLFDAAALTLEELDGQRDTDVKRLVLRFELAALRLLGHLPSLDRCVETGKPVPTEGHLYFGLLAGGVLSSEARPGHRKVVRVHAEVIRLFKQFADGDQDAWRSTPIDSRIAGELRGLVNSYMSHVLGHEPKMLPYMGMLN